MPNQRSTGQKLINIQVDERFIIALERAVREAGYDDRSKFIRDAIYEKLEREGFPLPRGLHLAPSRSGKGGRQSDEQMLAEERPQNRSGSYPKSTTAEPIHDAPLHGTANSKQVSRVARATKKTASKVAGVSPKSSH